MAVVAQPFRARPGLLLAGRRVGALVAFCVLPLAAATAVFAGAGAHGLGFDFHHNL